MVFTSTLSDYKQYSFDTLKQACSNCTKCSLHKDRNQVVFGSGPKQADIMIIGEAPGEKEDEQGLPFVGRSGQLLTTLLEAYDIHRNHDVFIANTVKCRPPKNRTPLAAEIAACKPFLEAQLNLIKPKIILLLGSPALKSVLNEKKPISKVRGMWYKRHVSYMKEPLMIMPLFHPAYLLRNPSKEHGKPIWLTKQDIKQIKNVFNDKHNLGENA